MTNHEFIEEYKFYFLDTYVEGFRLEGQFPVLELHHTEKELIVEINFDCMVQSNDEELNRIVQEFQQFEKDQAILLYLIAVNLKHVDDVAITENGNLIIEFSNEIQLHFKLMSEWPEPMNVSIFKEGELELAFMFSND